MDHSRGNRESFTKLPLPTPPRPLLRRQATRLHQQERPVNQKEVHMNSNFVPGKIGSTVPAPSQAPQVDTSREVRPARVQPGPWRRKSPLPLLATAPPMKPTTPTLLTRLRRIIPKPQQNIRQGTGHLPRQGDHTHLTQPQLSTKRGIVIVTAWRELEPTPNPLLPPCPRPQGITRETLRNPHPRRKIPGTLGTRDQEQRSQ